MNATFLDRLIVIGATMSVLYFSYIPLVLVVNMAGFDKIYLFVALAGVSFLLLVLRGTLTIPLRVDRSAGIVALLYSAFVAYAIVRFVAAPEFPDAWQTLRTLVLVNPLFIAFALYCRTQKKLALRLLLGLSAVYVLFLVNSIIRTSLSEVSEVLFQSVGIEGLYYQNVNMYIGLFIISSIYFTSSESAWRWPLLGAAMLSLVGMLAVGGRASFVAVLAVLGLHFLQGLMRANMAQWLLRFLLTLPFVGLVLLLLFSYGFGGVVESSLLVDRFAVLLEGGDSSLRIFLFGSALKLWLTDPLTVFFGAGISSFPVSIGESGAGWYPHNFVLELLAEFGVVGCFLFLLPIGYTGFKFLESVSDRTDRDLAGWVIFLIGVYFLIIACFTGGLDSSWVFLYFVFLILPSASPGTEFGDSKMIKTQGVAREFH